MKKGLFLAFEGIDGSGKTTQLSMLAERLSKITPCFATKEPSEGPIGTMIRQVLSGRLSVDTKTLAALFAADRLDHILNEANGILRKIDSGITVLTDRYYFSSYAYNSEEVSEEWLIGANSLSAQLLRPDCTIFVDVSAEAAMERISKNRFDTELFETTERLKKTRENFFRLFERFSEEEKVLVVDGDRSPEKISEEIWEHIQKML